MHFLLKIAFAAVARQGLSHDVAVFGQLALAIALRFELVVGLVKIDGRDACSSSRTKFTCQYFVKSVDMIHPLGTTLKVLNIAGPDWTSMGGKGLHGALVSVPPNVGGTALPQVESCDD